MTKMVKRNKTQLGDATRNAILSEMATPIKPVKQCERQWDVGQRVIYRGIKARVVVQHGNWVRIEEDNQGASYQVYADLLHGRGESPDATPLPPNSKTKAQRDANEVLQGCVTRAQYLKAVAAWPEVAEYVDEMDFGSAGTGLIKMRISNKLRAAIRRASNHV